MRIHRYPICRTAAIAAFILLPSLLHADAVVNLCTADNEPVAGVDLSRAITTGGHITFSCPAGSVIVITQPRIISGSLQIDGAGVITLDARGASAMFALSGGSANLTLTGLTLRGGIPRPGAIGGVVAPGGIVSGQGTVVINNSTITASTAPINLGGGQVTLNAAKLVNNSGVVIHAPSIFLSNSVIQGGTGNPMTSSAGRVTIDHSTIIGGAGSAFDGGCMLSISGSQFSGSSASAISSACDTFVSTSQFTGNHGVNGGALYLAKTANGLSISGSTFSGNVASAQGGAIAFEPDDGPPRTLAMTNVTFDGNAAGDGGAVHLGSFIENANTLQGAALIFSANRATKSGGAISGTNAQINISRALFVNNSAGMNGGAIESQLFGVRPGVIANALFAANSAQVGSAFHGAGMTFVNVTIANNTAGPAISAFVPGADPKNPQPYWLIGFHNVALWKNTVAGCESGMWSAYLQDKGQNLQFPAAGCPATIPVADPGFDSMYVPALKGPASGTGDLKACIAVPVGGIDLFGRHRPQGAGCSIGAVEGDLQTAVQQRNPILKNPPKAPPSNCPCAGSTSTGTSSGPASPPASTVIVVPPYTPPGSTTPPASPSPKPNPSQPPYTTSPYTNPRP